MASPEDTDLMLAAGQGDRDAFGVLVGRYYPAIVQFVQGFLGARNRDAAEDVAQGVFLAAWEAAPAFQQRAKVLTWLFRIATNACLDRRRRDRRRAAASLDSERAPEVSAPMTDHPDARAAAQEAADGVRRAVAGLPVNQRAAILLRHFHGMPYSEIADVLETSVSAVESLLFRARRSLERALAAVESDASPQVLPEVDV